MFDSFYTNTLLFDRLYYLSVVFDFFDQLKSNTKGYASFDYEFIENKESNLVKMDIYGNIQWLRYIETCLSGVAGGLTDCVSFKGESIKIDQNGDIIVAGDTYIYNYQHSL